MSRKKNPSSRDLIITANWKMHKTIGEGLLFVETLAPLIGKSQAKVYIAPPFTALYSLGELIKKKKMPLTMGAQNMHDAMEGAFTGEIAAKMLKDVGASFVILGHSERRHIFKESSAFINKKVKRAQQEGLQVVLCIGETGEEREQGRTHEILEKQLFESLDGVSEEGIKNMILSYEPVWAIGTGKVAKPEDAEIAHKFCRELIASHWSKDAAMHLVIQYGGSVQPENAAALISMPNVDGLLVGGASLTVETFSQIINQANSKHSLINT